MQKKNEYLLFMLYNLSDKCKLNYSVILLMSSKFLFDWILKPNCS